MFVCVSIPISIFLYMELFCYEVSCWRLGLREGLVKL